MNETETLPDDVLTKALAQAARDPRVLMCMDIGREVAFERKGVFVPITFQWELGLRLAADRLRDEDWTAEDLKPYQPSMESDATQDGPR